MCGHEHISALAHCVADFGSLRLPGLRLLVIMNIGSSPFLACGPGPEVLFFYYAVLGGGILCVVCFLGGALCIFTRLRSFGLLLVSFSVLLAGGILWRLGIFG